jgi:hypothetical protein
MLLISRSNLGHLIQGSVLHKPPFVLEHLSLSDRYWQHHLRTYRCSLISQPLHWVQEKYTLTLLQQLKKDIHPIFGAYILYLRSFEFLLVSNLQLALDQIQHAIRWLETWRKPHDLTDLSQRVSDGNYILK